MQPLNLKLYNSKGINRGLGLQNLEIDFSVFKEGLVLFYGPTGSGKTTILNSLNFNRPNFTANFDPDGFLELTALHKNHKYFAQIYENKASLFKDDILLNKTQKISEYDEYVEKEFGDPKVFFKLMYAGRKFKNLLDSTSGEKKQLLLDYLLDYLKLYEEKYQPKLQEEYKRLSDKWNFLQGKIANKENILNQIFNLEDEIKLKKILLDSNKEALTDLTKLQENYLLQEKENEKLKSDISTKNIELNNLINKSESIQNYINFYNNKVAQIRIEFDNLNRELAKVIVDTVTTKWTKETLIKEIDRVKEEISKKNIEKVNFEYSLKAIFKEIKEQLELKKELNEYSLPCTSELQIKCIAIKYRVFSDRVKVNDEKLEELAKRLDKEKKQLEKLNLHVESRTKYLKELELDILPKINSFEESKIKKKKREELKLEAKNLKENLDPLENQLKDIKEQTINVKDLIETYQLKIIEEWQDKTNEINTTNVEIRVCEDLIESKTRELGDLNTSILKLENDEVESKNLLEEASEYPLLIEFFGKNGGVVFDLEQVGSEISEIANKLLENYQDKKILLKFDTVYKNKEGKYIEDFNMSFSINGSEWKTYLSDGESGIIANVIREGVSYLDQKSQYKTTCVDEIDGSLDVKRKIDFIKLLEEGHKLNNRYFTFLISHSKNEVFPYIQQRIILEPKNTRIRLEY